MFVLSRVLNPTIEKLRRQYTKACLYGAIRVVEHLKGPVAPVNTCVGDDDLLDVGAMM
ncbi:MAG: hypothetical protein OXL96_24805 [Candidatus Poribacteria bacterium]|nr:hypothetical protein [Candidatus Poribacteria bacterium]